MRITSTGARRSALAAASPPKPPPTITTRGTGTAIAASRVLIAQTKKTQQQLVLLFCELLDRTIGGLLQHPIRNRLLERRGDLRIPEGLHHAAQRIHEMLHEVLDPTRAAADVPLQARAHDAPAEARSPAHRVVGIGDAQDAFLDEVSDLPIERRLEPVRDVSRELLPQVDRLLADRGVKAHRLLDGLA